jgi:Glyoxalase-like domain
MRDRPRAVAGTIVAWTSRVCHSGLRPFPWDCADHEELATFTPALLTGTRLWTHQDGAAVDAGGVVLVMQRIEDYQPPAWPGTSIVHLELNGDVQIGELERRAVALAARPAPVQPDPRWRVLLDPVGHPFCITPSPRE